MRTIKESNQIAKQTCDNTKYRYLYGGKDQEYTKALVDSLAKAYPSVYSSVYKLAMQDADKGYKAIDCSGFVCKVLGIANQGSGQIKANAYKTYSVVKANAKEGMALWKSGHIAYVGEGLKVYEACSTSTDMKVSDFDKRASAFTHLLVVKGSALEEELKKPSPAINNKIENKSTKTFAIGDKVTFTGTIYANANGTGNSVKKTKATMYIVGISKGSKYPYGLSAKKGGTRQGWTKLN